MSKELILAQLRIITEELKGDNYHLLTNVQTIAAAVETLVVAHEKVLTENSHLRELLGAAEWYVGQHPTDAAEELYNRMRAVHQKRIDKLRKIADLYSPSVTGA
jgi:regulator of replication initiation timing